MSCNEDEIQITEKQLIALGEECVEKENVLLMDLYQRQRSVAKLPQIVQEKLRMSLAYNKHIR